MSTPASPERPVAQEEPRSKSPASQQASPQDAVADDEATLAHPAADVESSESGDEEEGEIDEEQAPPLPADGPPLPQEAPPAQDDGWDCQWDSNSQSWFFHNRFTGKTQWDNPRVPSTDETSPSSAPQPPAEPPATGYNPAIHGDYDPNAWYAQKYNPAEEPAPAALGVPSLEDGYASTAGFNRFTGQFQQEDAGPARHSDESKSRRQMSAFFDVDAAANADDGRSLKAERSNKRISKSEVKAFKEKRRARKEEKRRAWLRD
jgi:hypothetical protein